MNIAFLRKLNSVSVTGVAPRYLARVRDSTDIVGQNRMGLPNFKNRATCAQNKHC